MTTPSLSRAGFDGLVERSGMKLPEATKAELYGIWGHIEEMLARLRRPRDLGADPAVVFTPGPEPKE